MLTTILYKFCLIVSLSVLMGCSSQATPPLQVPQTVKDPSASQANGYVILNFDITELGTTTNIAVVDSTNPKYNNAAINYVKTFKYKPKKINGKPVIARNVLYKIRFIGEDTIYLSPNSSKK